MTKEQEETIERLNNDKNKPLYCGDITIVNVEDIEILLNMLKEKDRLLARNVAKNFTFSIKEAEKAKEDLEMLNRGWQIELEKKDKIIDLMAEEIAENILNTCPQADYNYNLDCENRCNNDYKKCWKQYFERKGEE